MERRSETDTNRLFIYSRRFCSHRWADSTRESHTQRAEGNSLRSLQDFDLMLPFFILMKKKVKRNLSVNENFSDVAHWLGPKCWQHQQQHEIKCSSLLSNIVNLWIIKDSWAQVFRFLFSFIVLLQSIIFGIDWNWMYLSTFNQFLQMAKQTNRNSIHFYELRIVWLSPIINAMHTLNQTGKQS